MNKKQVYAAPAYLHETLLQELLHYYQTNALGNISVVPFSAFLPEALTNESIYYEQCFACIQKHKNSCPHFASMIDNPSFLKQLCDFRNELSQYEIPFSHLPEQDEFQKELKFLLETIQHLPTPSLHYNQFLTQKNDYQHIHLFPSYQSSPFLKKAEDHMFAQGAVKMNMENTVFSRIGRTALNRRQEIEACAQYIIEHQLPLDDINIILCDPVSDQKIVRLVFERYGLSYGFTSTKEKSRIVQLFLSSVQFMKERNISALLSFLHSSYPYLNHFDDFIHYLDLFVESVDELSQPLTHVADTLKSGCILDERELDKLVYLEEHAEQVRLMIQFPQGEFLLKAAYDFCRSHELAQHPDELKVLYRIKEILENHFHVLNNPEYLNLICFEIEQLSISKSESILEKVCVTDLTHPVFFRKYGFVMGCIQSSFPNFKSCSGIFDEDYVAQVDGYPSKTERQKFNSNQTEWIFNCAESIIFSSSSADYEGKGRQMSVEIESRLDQKPTPWKINQYQKKHKVDFKISESTAKDLFLRKSRLHGSISSFERWFHCPASYFLTYGLKLRKQELPEFNIALMGTIQHAILEEVMERYHKNIHELTDDELIQITERIFSPVLSLFKKQKNILSVTKARCIKNIKLIFEFLNEMEQNTDFEPYEQEKQFRFTLLEEEDVPIQLQGIIDRIDMTHDMLRILDYKSSHKTLSISKVQSGLQLQLLTYLHVASLIYQKAAAGCYYVSLKNDDLKFILSKVDGRKFELVDADNTQDFELWIQSHRLDGMTFINTPMLDFDGKHIKNFKNGLPAKIYAIEDLSGLIHTIYHYLAEQLTSGNISLTPTEDACMFCDHFSICRFHSLKIKSIVPEELTSHFFKEVKKA